MTPIAPLPIVRSMLYRPSVFSSGASAVMFKTLLHPLVVYCQLSWGRQPPTRQNVGNATRRPKPSHAFNHPGVVASCHARARILTARMVQTSAHNGMVYSPGQRARATSCRRKAAEVVSKCFAPDL